MIFELTSETVCGEPGPNLFVSGSKADGLRLRNQIEQNLTFDWTPLDISQGEKKIGFDELWFRKTRCGNFSTNISDDRLEISIDEDGWEQFFVDMSNAISNDSICTLYLDFEKFDSSEDFNWIMEF